MSVFSYITFGTIISGLSAGTVHDLQRRKYAGIVKSVLSGHSNRRPKISFQDRLSLNAGQKYCREHSAILSTFIKLPFVFKTVVLSIFEWPLKTGFTALSFIMHLIGKFDLNLAQSCCGSKRFLLLTFTKEL